MLKNGMELRCQEKLNFIFNVSNLYEIWDLKQILLNVYTLKLVGIIDDSINW